MVLISLVSWLPANSATMTTCVSNMVSLPSTNRPVLRARAEVEERSLMCASASSVRFVGSLKVRLSLRPSFSGGADLRGAAVLRLVSKGKIMSSNARRDCVCSTAESGGHLEPQSCKDVSKSKQGLDFLLKLVIFCYFCDRSRDFQEILTCAI